MKVLAIEKLKSRRKFHILLEGDNQIEVSEDVLVDFGLRRGDELTPDTLEHIKRAQTYHDAYAAGIRLINFRQRTRSELSRRLAQKGFDRTTIGKVIERLSQLGLINDEEFAKAFVNAGSTGKLLGKRSLIRKLREKGIDRETAEKALGEFANDEKQMTIAIEAAKKKLDRLSGEGIERKIKKLSTFLISRGFEWEIVKKVIRELLLKDVDDEYF
ncbi:MAG: regulatory protein RecX [Candidatus Kryptoniota bacterium]